MAFTLPEIEYVTSFGIWVLLWSNAACIMQNPRNQKVAREVEPWWHALNEECPITLELLSTLPYPPFSLCSGAITSYFDGLALASYIVSRGIFQNPLTREDLTMADCRRLDEYLETYCYNTPHQPLSTSRKISVAEAFALRSLVQVDQVHQSASRAQALRSTATAALAGLFVYGNHRRRGRQISQQDEPDPLPLPREDRLILDWGFDLTRTVDDSTAGFAQEGWTVIDDDEAEVVASQREAYNAAQNAFPRLSGGDLSEHTSTPNNSGAPALDEHIVERVRELSVQEEEARMRRERQIEVARQRRLNEALARREERRRIQLQQLVEGSVQWQKQKEEHEEIDRARAEIEQWREQQWEKLRLLSESHQKKPATKDAPSGNNSVKIVQKEEEIEAQPPSGPTPEEIAEQKKAKAAAKRKRAKDRKKAQKDEERAEQVKVTQQKEMEAKKAASALQCHACGQGILDCGFEKYGNRFCSPKCARTAQPPR